MDEEGVVAPLQAAEAELAALREAQQIDADYIKWLCERLDAANAEMREYREACWRMAKEKIRHAAQPPTSDKED